ALVEVPTDRPAPPDGELAIQVPVNPVDRLVAVHGGALTPRVTSGFGRRLRRCRDQAAFATEVPQPLLELLSSAVEPAHDRADGHIHDLGDLLVGEALDVG